MNSVKKIRCLALAGLCVLMLGVPAHALDPNQPASSFLRTHFTTDEGLPGAVIDHIDQTNDGFLWLISNTTNLSRFVGKNFYNYVKRRPGTLVQAPNGDLLIGTAEGVMRIPSTNFNQFTLSGLPTYQPDPGKASQIWCLRFSSSGVLWVGTGAGLFRYDGTSRHRCPSAQR